MCGIAGFNWRDDDLLERMMKALEHRGPDGAGRYSDDRVSLGHNLLSITETVENGAQPVVSEDGSQVLCYNGEIYNYRDLRRELKQSGRRFRTDCDTEVLFQGLRKEGLAFLSRLDGMFSIAWYDRDAGTISLARDRFGVKPLYVSQIGAKLIFASEIKGLLEADVERRLDPMGFANYLHLGYVPGPVTLIKNIRKLRPGEVVTFNRSSGTLIDSYNLVEVVPEPIGTFEPDTFRSIVGESIGRSLMGRRKIGLLLSGGLDSSVILHEAAARATEIETFTTSFDVETDREMFNEDAVCARRLSELYGTRHRELTITKEMFFDNLEDSVTRVEEPRWNQSLPTYDIFAKYLADSGIIVMVGGEGGDEMMTGYDRHAAVYQRFMQYHGNGPLGRFVENLRVKKRLFGGLSPAAVVSNVTASDPICTSLESNLLRPRPLENVHWPDVNACNAQRLVDYLRQSIPVSKFSSDPINNELYLWTQYWLPEEALTRHDKLGMAVGIEARFPWLLKAVADYCFSLPMDQKIDAKVMKKPSRIAYGEVLPDFIVNKRKSGWRSPTDIWANSPLFAKLKKNIISADYYEPTSQLFDFDSVLNEKPMKSVLPTMYFQIWARHFNIVV